MSTARIFESELVLLIVIQNSCQGEGVGGGGGGGGRGGSDDKFIIHVVKMVYGKMSSFRRWVSHEA